MSDEILTPYRGIRADLNLGTTSLDCYMMPSLEKRVGIAGASIALGYNKNWLGRLLKGDSGYLGALHNTGFTGLTKSLQIGRNDISGASTAITLSIRDFIKLTTLEALKKKTHNSIVLLAAFAEIGLEYAINELFVGRSVEFVADKIRHYSTWTFEELMEVLAYNREELRNLYLGIED